jgi:hypothetical protein
VRRRMGETMADYYPLIARAVSNLVRSTAETRAAIYNRARAAMLAQLRGVTPLSANQTSTANIWLLRRRSKKSRPRAIRTLRRAYR